MSKRPEQPERKIENSKEFNDALHAAWQLSALSFVLRGFCLHHLEIRLDNMEGRDIYRDGASNFNEEFNWVVWTLGDLYFSLSERVVGKLSELQDAGYALPAKRKARSGDLRGARKGGSDG